MGSCRLLGILTASILFFILLNQVPSAVSASSRYNGTPAVTFNMPLTPKEIRRLKAKGVEVLPSAGGSITSNSVTGEPTCEELKAMWRYYKRQSRAAELTNQIPRLNLPDLFWDLPKTPDYPAGFGPFRSGKTRQRYRMQKAPYRKPVYGQVLLAPPPGKEKTRRPVEEVVRILGPTTANRNMLANPERLTEPTVHYAPPVGPTPESSFSKLRDMYRKERQKDQFEGRVVGGIEAQDNSNGPPLVSNSKDYGRLVLGPPPGQDGRVANKPKELMSPFEKLRFHGDDVMGFTDEIDGRHNMMSPYMTKRRNGFIGIPILNPRDRNPVLLRPPKNKIIKVEREGVDEPRLINHNLQSDNSEPGFFQDMGEDGGSFYNELGVPNQTPFGEYADSLEDIILLRGKPEVENPPCPQVENQVCSSNADCACVGFGLYRCYSAQCQILPLNPTDGDDWSLGNEEGIWHPGALADKYLGGWEQSSVPGGGKNKKLSRPSP